jgi:hypothetical protein
VIPRLGQALVLGIALALLLPAALCAVLDLRIEDRAARRRPRRPFGGSEARRAPRAPLWAALVERPR